MNLKMKKVIAWVLVCLCVYGSMPKEMVKAASAVLYRKYLYPLKRLSGKTFGNHTARCGNDE